MGMGIAGLLIYIYILRKVPTYIHMFGLFWIGFGMDDMNDTIDMTLDQMDQMDKVS